jgi:hypothetical protein
MVLDAVGVFGAEVRRLVESDGATVALGNIVEGGQRTWPCESSSESKRRGSDRAPADAVRPARRRAGGGAA